MPSAERFAAVVVAAGSGRRFGDEGPPKQFRPLAGHPLLAWSIHPFLTSADVRRTVVVLPEAEARHPPDWLAALPVEIVAGGAERGDSVRNGLGALRGDADFVLVHDGARPLLSPDLLRRILAAAGAGPVIPGLPVVETVKEVDADGSVVRTIDRSRLWRVQTPQAFPLALLAECHRRAADEGVSGTDDAALLERYGHPVKVIEGDPDNLKVTTATDLTLAEVLARGLPRSRHPSSHPADQIR